MKIYILTRNKEIELNNFITEIVSVHSTYDLAFAEIPKRKRNYKYEIEEHEMK